MDVAVHIGHGVIDDLVCVLALQPFVREKKVSVQRRTGFNVLFNFSLESALLAVRDYHGADLAATLYDAEHGSLIFATGASDPATALCDMHIASFATDKGFTGLHVPTGFLDAAI